MMKKIKGAILRFITMLTVFIVLSSFITTFALGSNPKDPGCDDDAEIVLQREIENYEDN